MSGNKDNLKNIVIRGLYGFYNLGDDLALIVNLLHLKMKNRQMNIYVSKRYESYKDLLSSMGIKDINLKVIPYEPYINKILSRLIRKIYTIRNIPQKVKCLLFFFFLSIGLIFSLLEIGVSKTFKKFYRDIDIIYYSGGGYFNERWIDIIYRELIYLLIIRFLKKNIRVIGTGLGIGPFHTQCTIFWAKKLFEEFDIIGVREKRSLRILEDMGLEKKCILTCDDVVRLPIVSPGILTLRERHDSKSIGLNIKDFPDHKISYSSEFLNNLIKKFLDDNYLINFYLFGKKPGPDDIGVARMLLNEDYFNVIHIFDPYENFIDFINSLSNNYINIGFAYHFIILSLTYSVPVISGYYGEYYKQKILGALELWNCFRYVIQDEIEIDKVINDIDNYKKHLIKMNNLLVNKSFYTVNSIYKKYLWGHDE